MGTDIPDAHAEATSPDNPAVESRQLIHDWDDTIPRLLGQPPTRYSASWGRTPRGATAPGRGYSK